MCVKDRPLERTFLQPSTALQPMYNPAMLPQQHLAPQVMNNKNWAHEFLDESMYVYMCMLQIWLQVLSNNLSHI